MCGRGESAHKRCASKIKRTIQHFAQQCVYIITILYCKGRGYLPNMAAPVCQLNYSDLEKTQNKGILFKDSKAPEGNINFNKLSSY